MVFLGPTQALEVREIWYSLHDAPLAPDDIPMQVGEALLPECDPSPLLVDEQTSLILFPCLHEL